LPDIVNLEKLSAVKRNRKCTEERKRDREGRNKEFKEETTKRVADRRNRTRGRDQGTDVRMEGGIKKGGEMEGKKGYGRQRGRDGR
jgi:hypothetical protein